jgi:predicted transcriptional regulator
MTRTTVSLPPEVDAALRRQARRRGVAVSQIVREAVEARLGMGKARRDLPFIGLVNSGHSTVAENIDAILEAEWTGLDRDR